jgi:hypothetical protein
LLDWLKRESALEIGQAVVKEPAEQKLPAFAMASQNVAVEATLLDALLAPSTDGVGEVYQ